MQSVGHMSWKDKIKKHTICNFVVMAVLLILTGIATWIIFPQSQSGFDDLLKKYSGYKMAIIAASLAVLGILIYIGNSLAKKVKYRFIELFLGLLFLLVIVVTYVAKQNIVTANKLIYIEIIVFLALLFGWIMGICQERGGDSI